MAGEVLSGGNIEPRALEDEMRTAFLDYAMSVIVSARCRTCAMDSSLCTGACSTAMNELGLGPTRRTRSPHGSSAR